MYMKIRLVLLPVFLFAGTGVVLAEDDDICAPFKDGLVDESLLETMLSAAHVGADSDLQGTHAGATEIRRP